MSYSGIVKCAKEGCGKNFPNDRFGHIRAHKDGWFHESKDGISWCPDHKPAWVDDRRLRRKKGV